MSTINEFPWQEHILRNLQGGLSVTVADLTATIEAGDAGEDAVRHDVDHLAGIGLIESDGEQVRLTREGEVAASRLP
jgi:hypothetical protein